VTGFSKPAARPASRGDLLAETLDLLRVYIRDELNDCLPCRVTAVVGEGVNVQILAPTLLADGSLRAWPEIPAVPVAFPGSQGAVLWFDLQPGALGLLKACDRDISLILEALSEARPNTLRLHSFSDAFFLPTDFSPMTPGGTGAAMLQTRDGAAFVSVGADEISASIAGSELSMAAGEIKATVGPSTAVLTADGFTVTIAGVPLEFTGAGLKMGGIEIGPLHKHSGGTISGSTGPVTP
jgi:hypothetical protein